MWMTYHDNVVVRVNAPILPNRRSATYSPRIFWLRITYHEANNWQWFELRFDNHDEWLQRVREACALISSIHNIQTNLVVAEVLHLCYSKENPIQGVLADLFIPVDRHRLEQIFGPFNSTPVKE